jgi:hypothetical protein
MTLERFDTSDDDVLASLATLPACDVSQRRSRQLRRRCHARLQAEPPATRWAWLSEEAPFERTIGPAIGAAWCLLYVVEIVCRTAAMYGHFGAR